MTLAITGGAGYIGSFIIKHFIEQNYPGKIIVIDFRSSDFVEKNTTFYKVDLLNRDQVNDVFEKEKIEVVIHCAAYCNVGESMKTPTKYLGDNYNMTLNLLEAMRTHDVKKIIFSSTCTVYGSPNENPEVNEESKIQPESIYADGKVICEQLLIMYCKYFDLNCITFRYFNPCGAALDGSLGPDRGIPRIVPIAIKAKKENKPISVFGNTYNTSDGTCVRDYIHIEDLAAAHSLAVERLNRQPCVEVFNLGSGKGRTILEVLKEIGVDHVFHPARPGDVEAIWADVSRAKKELNWSPKYDFKEMIESEVAWYNKEI